VIVVERLLAGFTDGLERVQVSIGTTTALHMEAGTYLQRRKVDDTVDVRVSFKHLVEGGFVSDIELRELGLLARDQLDAVKGFGGGVVQVIGDDDLVPGLEQGEGSEGANVAGSTMEGSIIIGVALDMQRTR
jgi:hypothetical protein